MINSIGIQLYTVRDFLGSEEQIVESLRKLHEMGYSDLHTAGFNIPIPRFAELVKEAGMHVIGTHYGYDEIINKTDETMENHRILGTTNIGIGGMPGYARSSKEGLLKFIAEVNAVAETLAKNGFKFTYHNHSFEFVKLDGKRIIDYLADGFDRDNVTFVLDTYWVQHGGGDVIAWMKKLAGRIDILHLKDMKMTSEGQKYSEILEGNLNFDGIIEAAEQIGVKYYIVEQDTCPGDPFDSAKISADNIRGRYMK